MSVPELPFWIGTIDTNLVWVSEDAPLASHPDFRIIRIGNIKVLSNAAAHKNGHDMKVSTNLFVHFFRLVRPVSNKRSERSTYRENIENAALSVNHNFNSAVASCPCPD